MVSTADSYAAFQQRLDGAADSIGTSVSPFCGYSKQDIAARLLQRCAEIGVFNFTRICAEKYKRDVSFPDAAGVVDCGGVVFGANNKVAITINLFIKLIFEYALFWCYAFLTILVSLKLFDRKKRVTLIYGIGLQDLQADGSDDRFLRFCHETPVSPIVDSEFLVIQSVKRITSCEPQRVKYDKLPLFKSLRCCGLGIFPWIAAISTHVWILGSFLRAVFSSPIMILLARDASCHAVAAACNQNRIFKDVVFTNTNYFSQPLWSWALPKRSFSSHIAWYSQNNFPISFVDENSAVPIPNLRFIRCDIQWVWSEGFKLFLKSICPPCDYKVVGPIVWHLPSRVSNLNQKTLRVTIFDVTPVNKETEIRLGLIRNIYTNEFMIQFLVDVLEGVEQIKKRHNIEIEVVLKHKREHSSSFHSKEYVCAVDKLVESNRIKLAKPSTNIFDIINSSYVVVAAPYSSPVYIADHLGKRSFWYDPTGMLDWKLERPEIPLVQKFDNLCSSLQSALGHL